MKLLVTAMCGVLLLLCASSGSAARYGIARSAAPVLNTAAISTVIGGTDGRTLKHDRCGQVRELEYIALPGTVFRILDEVKRNGAEVYRVETEEYPAPAGKALFVDSRFIALHSDQPLRRQPILPQRDRVIETLKTAVGSPYVWGGNVRQGIPELLEMFYRGELSTSAAKQLILAGLDCSGLLYEATDGWTPRNTSELVSFGRGVPVADKAAAKLAGVLQPLDLIVWNGHVIIVLDNDTTIESRLECGKPGNGGVVVTPLRQRLAEVLRTRRPVDTWPAGSRQRDIFVVRRWYGL